MIIGHHAHHGPDVSRLCDPNMWTPLLSHQLYKTLGRSVAPRTRYTLQEKDLSFEMQIKLSNFCSYQ